MSSGDALRQQISMDTEIGRKAKAFMNEGKLVPDDVMVELMTTTLKDLDANPETKNWLLDGFPRTVEQAATLDESFDLGLVMHLDVPDEEIVDRIRHRFVHLESGRVYHTLWNPPKVEGKDDVTGEPLIQREDDKEDVVRERLEKYRAVTVPIVERYTEKGVLCRFAGTESDVIYPGMHAFVQGWVIGSNMGAKHAS